MKNSRIYNIAYAWSLLHQSVLPCLIQCLITVVFCQYEDNGIELLANAAVNPTAATVYHLHNKWRMTHFGSSAEPLVKLAEKIDYYNYMGKYEEDYTQVTVYCVILLAAELLNFS